MRLMLAIIAACLSFGMSESAMAEDRRASSLPGWEAVGRLNIAGKYMCTGTLIASNLVLTAAHCVYDAQTGRRVNPRGIRFEAGLDGRRFKAARMVSKAVIHPAYQFRTGGDAQLGHDIAVLRLSTPISRTEIRPFTMSARADRGASVDVLSYSYHNATRANRQQGCHVLSRRTRTLVMSCRVDFGASGAPVLDVTPGQAPKIVSVISSKAAMGSSPGVDRNRSRQYATGDDAKRDLMALPGWQRGQPALRKKDARCDRPERLSPCAIAMTARCLCQR